MGALVFWLGVGFLVALALVAARGIDRRDRRDAVAGDSIGHPSSDRSWTAHSRQVENPPRA